MQTMQNQILKRIERLEPGKALSAKDFLDIASRTTIDVALAKLATEGKIRRIRRGLYDTPKFNPLMALLISNSDALAPPRARLGILMVASLALYVSSWQVRRMEINHASE
jgi:Family of unknown function (DUF6088)